MSVHVVKPVDEDTETDGKDIIKNIDSKVRATTSHGYFHGHECHLDAEHLTAYNIKINPFRRFVFDLTSVRTSDVRALNMYRSYAALCAEKYRHYKHHPFTIHPFSKLRLLLETTLVVNMIVLGLCLAIHYSEIHAGLVDYHFNIICICDITFVLHIITNFFTGYIAGQTQKYAILDLDKIAYNYMKTWMIIDLFTLMSFISLVLNIGGPMSRLILEAAKLLRLPNTIKYIEHILLVTGATIYQKIVVKILFTIVTYISWNIFFQFCVEYTIEGTFSPTNPRKCSWLTYGKLWNATLDIRFLYAMDRAVGMLTTNTNMNVIEDSGCFEIFFVLAWFISKLLIWLLNVMMSLKHRACLIVALFLSLEIHFALTYVIALFGTESSRVKYNIMQKQVEHYMTQRKFPPRLKKKILKFYAIRFQSKYFTESRLLDAVSGQLREDILMHTGRQLVRELEFLKLLPRSLLMQIVFKLRVVIFIAGDIIFKINTVGDCLYFIDKGTVAIYSESAQEVCHLEDGDFFGEVALVMRQRFRATSAVAVTNCELFRLDREDFDSTIAYYPTVYENIKKVAIDRLDRTCVLDEHHKSDLKSAEGMQFGN